MSTWANVGALVGVAGSIYSAQASVKAGRAEQDIYRQRSRILQGEAASTLKASRERARIARFEARKDVSTIKSQIAKSGVRLKGTPMLSLAETARILEEDAGQIQTEGILEARRLREQAHLERKQGRYAAKAGRRKAYASLLTGGARFAQAGYEAGWGMGRRKKWDQTKRAPNKRLYRTQ